MAARNEVERWTVAKLLAVSRAKIAPASVTASTLLRQDLGVTSLQAVNLVLDAEEQFGIYVEDAELADLRTVGNVVDLVMAKLGGKGPATA